MDLGQVGQLAKHVLVTEGDVDDSVVCEGGHSIESGGFLATSLARGGLEDAGALSVEGTGAPESSCRVPEHLDTY